MLDEEHHDGDDGSDGAHDQEDWSHDGPQACGCSSEPDPRSSSSWTRHQHPGDEGAEGDGEAGDHGDEPTADDEHGLNGTGDGGESARDVADEAVELGHGGGQALARLGPSVLHGGGGGALAVGQSVGGVGEVALVLGGLLGDESQSSLGFLVGVELDLAPLHGLLEVVVGDGDSVLGLSDLERRGSAALTQLVELLFGLHEADARRLDLGGVDGVLDQAHAHGLGLDGCLREHDVERSDGFRLATERLPDGSDGLGRLPVEGGTEVGAEPEEGLAPRDALLVGEAHVAEEASDRCSALVGRSGAHAKGLGGVR